MWQPDSHHKRCFFTNFHAAENWKRRGGPGRKHENLACKLTIRRLSKMGVPPNHPSHWTILVLKPMVTWRSLSFPESPDGTPWNSQILAVNQTGGGFFEPILHSKWLGWDFCENRPTGTGNVSMILVSNHPICTYRLHLYTSIYVYMYYRACKYT